MKKYLFLFNLLIFICNVNTLAQCNVKTNNRPDGVTVNYMNPDMVGKGSSCELGLSISTDGTDFYLNTTVLYLSSPKKISGDLIIELSNSKSLVLELYTSELATMKGSEVSVSVFFLRSFDVNELTNNKIKKIIFKESSGKNQIIIVSQNSDLVSKQLKCLR
jgi:hypothetical protein